MKKVFILVSAALVAYAMLASESAQARHRWGHRDAGPIFVDEFGYYRCSEGPVYNFYRGSHLDRFAPAVYRGYAYRAYYRYTAYRIFPRTYACDGYLPNYGNWTR
jgi:hypothetical protein